MGLFSRKARTSLSEFVARICPLLEYEQPGSGQRWEPVFTKVAPFEDQARAEFGILDAFVVWRAVVDAAMQLSEESRRVIADACANALAESAAGCVTTVGVAERLDLVRSRFEEYNDAFGEWVAEMESGEGKERLPFRPLMVAYMGFVAGSLEEFPKDLEASLAITVGCAEKYASLRTRIEGVLQRVELTL